MKIGQLAKLSNLSIHTLRYYEKIGLSEKVYRNQSKQREYDDDILIWLEFINRLRETNMPLKGQIEYAKLRAKGNTTIGQRCEILEDHLQKLIIAQQKLNSNIKAMEAKIQIYHQLEIGNETKHT